MPSIELLGYSEEAGSKLESRLRESLADLDFRNEIIFVRYHSQISDFQANEIAYLRICTRNDMKAEVLMQRLKKFADVEFIKAADLVFKNS